jgi:DNA-directed RNA polymerase III subunit RPC7
LVRKTINAAITQKSVRLNTGDKTEAMMQRIQSVEDAEEGEEGEDEPGDEDGDYFPFLVVVSQLIYCLVDDEFADDDMGDDYNAEQYFDDGEGDDDDGGGEGPDDY